MRREGTHGLEVQRAHQLRVDKGGKVIRSSPPANDAGLLIPAAFLRISDGESRSVDGVPTQTTADSIEKNLLSSVNDLAGQVNIFSFPG